MNNRVDSPRWDDMDISQQELPVQSSTVAKGLHMYFAWVKSMSGCMALKRSSARMRSISSLEGLPAALAYWSYCGQEELVC